MATKSQLQLELREVAAGFHGFAREAANVTPTPLQFFDVALAVLNRVHAVRLLAGIVRARKIYRDADGIYRGTGVEFTCAEAASWGVPDRWLPQAIEDLVQAKLVDVVRHGKPASRGCAGISPILQLRYDERAASRGKYICKPGEFDGFCVKQGCYMDVPDEFFTVLIPAAELSTIRVVGVILRETLGWSDGYGNRRARVGISMRAIADRLRIHVSAVQRGLGASIGKYVALVEAGVFDPEAGANSKAAVYAVLYRSDDSPVYYPRRTASGPPTKQVRPRPPGTLSIEDGGSDGTGTGLGLGRLFPEDGADQGSDQTGPVPSGGAPTEQAPEGRRNGCGSSDEVRTAQVRPNGCDTKKASSKMLGKQQQNPPTPPPKEADDLVVVSLLSVKGISERVAKRLIASYGLARVRRVTEEVDRQANVTNPASWVVAALRDGYSFAEPTQAEQAKQAADERRRRLQERDEAQNVAAERLARGYEEYLRRVEDELRVDPQLYEEFVAFADARLSPFWKAQLAKPESKSEGPTKWSIGRFRREWLAAFCEAEGMDRVLSLEEWKEEQAAGRE